MEKFTLGESMKMVSVELVVVPINQWFNGDLSLSNLTIIKDQQLSK